MIDVNLRGRTALITGASRGLGKSMALALASAGAQLALVSRDQPALPGDLIEAALPQPWVLIKENS